MESRDAHRNPKGDLERGQRHQRLARSSSSWNADDDRRFLAARRRISLVRAHWKGKIVNPFGAAEYSCDGGDTCGSLPIRRRASAAPHDNRARKSRGFQLQVSCLSRYRPNLAKLCGSCGSEFKITPHRKKHGENTICLTNATREKIALKFQLFKKKKLNSALSQAKIIMTISDKRDAKTRGSHNF